MLVQTIATRHQDFKHLNIGRHFFSNGDAWIKVTTRTARICDSTQGFLVPRQTKGCVFYFSQSERVLPS